MKMLIQFTGTLLACLCLYGCGGAPYTYEPANELKPGPGLFSGEDGEFTLIDTANTEKEKEEAEQPE